MNKKQYVRPQATNMLHEIQAGVPGALKGALLMVGRALAKAMKGGVDIASGIDGPKVLQKPVHKNLN